MKTQLPTLSVSLTAFLLALALPAIADQTTVTINIDISVEIKGPVTCDMALNNAFQAIGDIDYPPPEIRRVLLLQILGAAPDTHISPGVILEVAGDSESNHLSSSLQLFVGGGTAGFISGQAEGKHAPVYNFALTSDAFSGSYKIAGAFPNGFVIRLDAPTLRVEMPCYGHGTVTLSFTGTLSQ